MTSSQKWVTVQFTADAADNDNNTLHQIWILTQCQEYYVFKISLLCNWWRHWVSLRTNPLAREHLSYIVRTIICWIRLSKSLGAIALISSQNRWNNMIWWRCEATSPQGDAIRALSVTLSGTVELNYSKILLSVTRWWFPTSNIEQLVDALHVKLVIWCDEWSFTSP